MPVFRLASPIATSPDELFAWHGRPGAFERLVPPWEEVTVERRDEPLLADGAELVLRMKVAPGVTVRWVARHGEVRPPPSAGEPQFVDEQVEGPFASWRHLHRFLPRDGGSQIVDEITWEPPGGAVLGWMAEGALTRRLERTFRFRHRRLQDDLARHQAFADRPRLRVAVTGASGLVGSALCPFLTSGGHAVDPVVRREAGSGEIAWMGGKLDQEALEGVDAVVHLAGAPIHGKRWTPAYKETILRSRVEGTRQLCEALARLERRPSVLVSGSAVGFYGDTGDREVTESDGPGAQFLSEVCVAWEEATAPAREAGIRVVNLRTGIVLARRSGALATMLPAFEAGVGGPIGGGRQYVPFIGLEDLVGIIHQGLFDERLEGPVNATAPEPVQQRDFAHTLGRVLGRPSFLPAPAMAVRLAMGRQMANELVLEGQRAVPGKLLELGFPFRYPRLEEALRFELGRE